MGWFDSLFRRRTVSVSGPLGSASNPVRCFDPSGERDYLDRLRWKDGFVPEFNRVGSFGEGPYGNVLDKYVVSRPGHEEEVFFDMYHKGYVERVPLAGWHICNLRTTSKSYSFERAMQEDAETLRRNALQSLTVEQCKDLIQYTAFFCGKLPDPKTADIVEAVAELGIADESAAVRAVRFVTGGNFP